MSINTGPNVKELKTKRNIEGLIQVLSHEDWKIRNEAILALMFIYPPPTIAIPALTTILLKDDEWTLRYESAVTLGNMGKAAGEAIPFLERALNDGDPHVRYYSADAMEKIIGKSFKEFKKKGKKVVTISQIAMAREPSLTALGGIMILWLLGAGCIAAIIFSIPNIPVWFLFIGWMVGVTLLTIPLFWVHGMICARPFFANISGLIDALDIEDSDFRYRAIESLMEITRESYGEDKEKWLQWLKKNKYK